VSRVVGVVLAAGAGVRMGAPKGELRVGGERLVDRAVRVLQAGGCTEVLAVIRPGVSVAGARAIVNPEPERGLRSSLALAVDTAEGVDLLVLLLADLPGVTASGVGAVIDAWRPGRIIAARYAGRRRGHPIAMAPALWGAALALAGPDEGARALLRARPELVDEIDVAGDASDLDTPADLARWQRGGGSGGVS
jgi:molybdenum cofactor cytidylyltransferase/nicotine blue oxidoreductase